MIFTIKIEKRVHTRVSSLIDTKLTPKWERRGAFNLREIIRTMNFIHLRSVHKSFCVCNKICYSMHYDISNIHCI